jgi:hypothetical protein
MPNLSRQREQCDELSCKSEVTCNRENASSFKVRKRHAAVGAAAGKVRPLVLLQVIEIADPDFAH